MSELIVIVSPSGAGKSFYVPHLEDKYCAITLSSDKLRTILCNGNTNDQSKNGLVFTVLKAAMELLLEDGHSVILDTTALTVSIRADYLKVAKKLGVVTRAVYIKASIEKCKERNRNRDRFVPEDVIAKQFTKLVIPTESEGFDFVDVIDND